MKNIKGHYFLDPHPGWGGCAEELFHYTSRYVAITEAFLKNLAKEPDFSMSGYRAALLNIEQRELMAAVFYFEPSEETARVMIKIVSSVLSNENYIDDRLVEPYKEALKKIPRGKKIHYQAFDKRVDKGDVSPVDPFLNIAERLQLPVAIVDHHVEVSLQHLAKYLDSPNSRIRINLQQAVLRLHNAGYLLRNHKELTHAEAVNIATEDAV